MSDNEKITETAPNNPFANIKPKENSELNKTTQNSELPIERLSISSMHILLVDDQHSFVMMMKVMLNTIGISKIDIASNADQAQKLCKRHTYDIYMFDYNLGDSLNGRQLMEKLREDNLIPYYASILIVTGDNSRAMVLSAIEQEPDDYMIKPFSHSQFKNRLNRALNKRRELLSYYKALSEKDVNAEIAELEKLIANNTKYEVFCRCLLAGCYTKTNQISLAQATLEEGLSQSNSSFLRQKLGEIYYLEHEYEKAIKQLEHVVKRHPFMINALKYLTYAYTDSNQLDAAMKTIKHAVLVSPMSVTLLQLQIEMALKTRDYLAARDACAMLLEVNKYFPNEVENLLGCYSQMELQFAQSSNEIMHIENMQKHLRNISTRYKKYTNQDTFNPNLFETIYQARIQMVKGENNKAKKALYKAYNSCAEELDKTSRAIVEHMRIGFNQLGEYEVSDQITHALKEHDKLHPKLIKHVNSTYEVSSKLLKQCVDNYMLDPFNCEKRHKYLELNEAGIRAYKAGDFDGALACFKDALKKHPANTNALLNKIQVTIDICDRLQAKNSNDSNIKLKITNSINEASGDLSGLDGLPLTPAQFERTNNLRRDIDRLKQKYRMR